MVKSCAGEVRAKAIWALGFVAEKARPAVPRLLSARSDSDLSVRTEATNALQKIALEVLTNGVKDF